MNFKHRILSRQEEIDLVLRWQKKRDQGARTELLLCNLRFVRLCVHRLAGKGPLAMEDIEQEARIGFLRALDDFDTARGLRLTTYAHHWVKHAIRRYIDRNQTEGRSGPGSWPARFWRERARAVTELSRKRKEVNDETIARQMGLTPKKYNLVRDAVLMGQNLSLDEPISRGAPATFVDVLADHGPLADAEAERDSEAERVRALLARLNPRERHILTERFYEDRTLRDIAEDLGLSRERVRQLEEMAMDRIQRWLSGKAARKERLRVSELVRLRA